MSGAGRPGGVHPNPSAPPTCHGCTHNRYTAPGGLRGDYPGKPAIMDLPHSRCSELQQYVPMVLGEHGKWMRSEIPPGCPVYVPGWNRQ